MAGVSVSAAPNQWSAGICLIRAFPFVVAPRPNVVFGGGMRPTGAGLLG
jgi:hypothetical protein